MRQVALTVVLATVAGIVLAVLVAPASYRVERSITVSAAPSTLVAQLADLQRWPAWPREAAPGTPITRSYGGRPGSPGATCYWSGDGDVGRGRLTVVGVGTDHVDLEVETYGARHVEADLEFRLASEGTATRVTSSLAGENGIVDRALWFLAGRRATLARALERRLDSLKTATESLPTTPVHRLEASSIIAASPEAIQARIADLRSWKRFSPWPGAGSATATFGGARSGVGSSVYWSDPGSLARGRMTIVADGPDGVEVEVEVADSAERLASNDLEFRFAPAGPGTRVTWTVTGEGGLEAAELDRSLSRLKALSEGVTP